MITRGHFIGEIIDSLSEVAYRAETRCRLNLTDLNVFLENFFRDILNIILQTNLINLNKNRSNEPGLDLGDEVKAIAFQITSQRSSEKINKTLSKVLQDEATEKRKYNTIHVLIIGKKQSRYTLDQILCNKYGFSEDDIWDLDTLCRHAVDLPLESLEVLHSLIKKQLTHVNIELEIPNPDGEYPTSLSRYVESIPKPSLGEMKKFHEFLCNEGAEDLKLKDVKKDVIALSRGLSELPRVTREFIAIIIERAMPLGNSHLQLNMDVVDRIFRHAGKKTDLNILQDYGFCDIEPADYDQPSPYLYLKDKGMTAITMQDIASYCGKNGIAIKKPFASLDFSDF